MSHKHRLRRIKIHYKRLRMYLCGLELGALLILVVPGLADLPDDKGQTQEDKIKTETETTDDTDAADGTTASDGTASADGIDNSAGATAGADSADSNGGNDSTTDTDGEGGTDSADNNGDTDSADSAGNYGGTGSAGDSESGELTTADIAEPHWYDDIDRSYDYTSSLEDTRDMESAVMDLYTRIAMEADAAADTGLYDPDEDDFTDAPADYCIYFTEGSEELATTMYNTAYADLSEYDRACPVIVEINDTTAYATLALYTIPEEDGDKYSQHIIESYIKLEDGAWRLAGEDDITSDEADYVREVAYTEASYNVWHSTRITQREWITFDLDEPVYYDGLFVYEVIEIYQNKDGSATAVCYLANDTDYDISVESVDDIWATDDKQMLFDISEEIDECVIEAHSYELLRVDVPNDMVLTQNWENPKVDDFVITYTVITGLDEADEDGAG